jgi:hypothetical protein
MSNGNTKITIGGSLDQPAAVATAYVVHPNRAGRGDWGICSMDQALLSPGGLPPSARRNGSHLDRRPGVCRMGESELQTPQATVGAWPGVVHAVPGAGGAGREAGDHPHQQPGGDDTRQMRHVRRECI